MGANSLKIVVLMAALVLILRPGGAQTKSQGDHAHLPDTYVPSGEVMYKQYCATCHGADGKGHGPAAGAFKTPLPDLTTLASRHGGKFPYAYVFDVLFWGPLAAHGSRTMPVWGPIFLKLDKRDDIAVRKRIENLSAYLACLQAAQEPRQCSTP
jgi:mono/diheme cytochrome c family protein